MKNARIDENTTTYIKKISKEYSLYVAQNRAIPSITDGLKAAQRKILWVLKGKNDKIKTVALSGSLLESNIYDHGDASASETISHMAAPFCNNVPLISGVGNFGTKIFPTEFSSPRYTYVKKSKITESLVYTDIDIIPLKENYDGSAMEPETFLPVIPLVLVNSTSGIAVGFSTFILSYNFNDIISNTINALQNKKMKKMIPFINHYDLDIKNIEDNKWRITGKVEIKDTSTVIIKEVPPSISFEKLKEHFNNLEDNGTIISYTDKSTNSINITVKFPRGSLKDKSEEQIISILKLTTTVTERIVVIDFNGENIITYDNPEKLVEDFVNWRLTWFYKRYEKFIEEDSYELIYQKGLKLCIESQISDRLTTHKTKNEVREDIISTTNSTLDDRQLERMMSIPMYKWTKDFINEVNDKIKQLNDKIKENTDILNDEDKLKNIYINDLENIKKLKI